jgi:AsmA protein
MSFDEKLTGVNVGKLANAMFEVENVTGTISGAFRLAGSGADVAAVQRSLDGSIQFELLEGYYEGTDVWYELRRARALLKKEEPPEATLPARTHFDVLRLSGPVNDGVFQNDEVFADLQFLRMTGKGTVDLATTDIDYNLTASVIERPEFEEGATEEEQQEFEKAVIPLRVTGTVAEPSIKPDVGKMLEKEVKKKVRERLLEELFGDEEETVPAEGEAQQLAPEEEKDDKDKLKDALRDLLKRD